MHDLVAVEILLSLLCANNSSAVSELSALAVNKVVFNDNGVRLVLFGDANCDCLL